MSIAILINLLLFATFTSSSFQSFQSKLSIVDQVCWSSSEPKIITIHSPTQQNQQQPLPQLPFFSGLEFATSTIPWKDVSEKANILIKEPVAFVFTFQCAFQHITRELLPYEGDEHRPGYFFPMGTLLWNPFLDKRAAFLHHKRCSESAAV